MLAAERAAAPRTLAAYRSDLEDFAAHLPRGALAAATSDNLSAYLRDLTDRGLSPRTAARRLSCLRQFHRFLVLEGVRPDDPCTLLEAPKRGLTLPKLLSLDEIDALLAATGSLEGRRGDTARAAILLLYAAGLRVSELLALERAAFARLPLDADVATDAPAIVIRGKGGRERLVPLAARAIDAARTLIARSPPSRHLFPGRDPRRALTRQGFDLILAEAGRAAGIPSDRLSPHVLRHSFASHMLENGVDLRHLQVLLGHADLATTQIYTHLRTERLARLVETHHPLAAPPPGSRPEARPSDARETC